MNSQLWWYTARSGGIVAWALLAASMIWGLAMSTKASVAGRRPRPNWMLDLHRFLGGAALVFVVIHVAAIMLDTYVDFGIVEVLVPFTSAWNPAAVAWGIVAVYLLVAVEVTSLLRKKISKRAWRITHMLSFPTFVLTTVHMLTAGTDRATVALRALTAAATVVIGTMTAWRILQLDRPTPTPTPAPTQARTQAPTPTPTAISNPNPNLIPAPATAPAPMTAPAPAVPAFTPVTWASTATPPPSAPPVMESAAPLSGSPASSEGARG